MNQSATNHYLIFLLIYIGSSLSLKAQIPADSLTGVYVGDYWVANPSSGPWNITTDTIMVSQVDSTNCSVLAFFPGGSYGGSYFTSYYSCNGTEPANYYMRFYAGDSLKWISDNSVQPPPNQPISRRFFGKRISGLTTSIPNFKTDGEISCYPNPAKDVLNVTAGIKTKISKVEIINSSGTIECYFSESFEPNSMQISVSCFPEGVYFIRVITEKAIVTRKIFIRR